MKPTELRKYLYDEANKAMGAAGVNAYPQKALQGCYSYRINEALFDVIPDHMLKRAPNGYYTRCPQCEIEGFDRSGTNLWISENGFGFKCFRNNGEHTTLDILRALSC